MKCRRQYCGGKLIVEDGEFGEIIRRCVLCSRSPDETEITLSEVLIIMKGVDRDGNTKQP